MGSPGFTLIELLVVAAVVAILAGLLLPTLGRARDRAYAAACLNHLKQLQLGWMLYANDHNDWLPPSEMNASVPKAPRWVDGNMSAFGDYAMTRTNRALLVAPGPGHIGPYVQAPDVFHCPGGPQHGECLWEARAPTGPKLLDESVHRRRQWCDLLRGPESYGVRRVGVFTHCLRPVRRFQPGFPRADLGVH
ncbi:MAG: prepilin-type N-terminal cleavage/methylation domain-containing protein [Verrucomicrobiota bacterium]